MDTPEQLMIIIQTSGKQELTIGNKKNIQENKKKTRFPGAVPQPIIDMYIVKGYSAVVWCGLFLLVILPPKVELG